MPARPSLRLSRRSWLLGAATLAGMAGLSWRARAESAPDPAAFDPAGIRTAFETAVAEGLIAGGSIYLLHNDGPLMKAAFGLADIEENRPFTTETVVHLASTSKPHTSTLIMTLVDEGLIDLDTPVSAYVPEIEGIALTGAGTPTAVPTMRQLLSHTAGFEGLDRMDYGKMVPLIFAPTTFGGATAAITKHGLAYAPGTDYRYTQLGMVVAAHVAETVSGQDWETLFRTRLADPIGASASTWYPTPKTLAGMAERYNNVNGILRPVGPRGPRAQGLPIDPAGSLVSDLDGIAALFTLHKNLGRVGDRQILSEAAIREIHKVQPPAPAYGLGMSLGWLPDDGTKAIVNHGGAFGTIGWADLETGVVGAMFIQTPPGQIPRWGRLIYTALYEAGVGRMVNYMRTGNPVPPEGRGAPAR
ncbi:MAG: beta-lactamase family protein [Alphaproteobacteria bacterium]|nr:beta-lactamase family protein [Alphaproteobacteria bacterium]